MISFPKKMKGEKRLGASYPLSVGGKVSVSVRCDKVAMGPAELFGHWAWISLIFRPGVMAAEFGIGIDTFNSAGSPPLCIIFMVPQV